MFLDDALERGLVAAVIPDPLGPDHSDRSGGANPKAIGFGPANPALAIKSQLAQAPLEEFPSGKALALRATLGFLGIGANEDMAAGVIKPFFGEILARSGNAGGVFSHDASIHFRAMSRCSAGIGHGTPLRTQTMVAMAKVIAWPCCRIS